MPLTSPNSPGSRICIKEQSDSRKVFDFLDFKPFSRHKALNIIASQKEEPNFIRIEKDLEKSADYANTTCPLGFLLILPVGTFYLSF